MSDAYAGKSNEQIINENAAALESKSSSSTSDSFNPRNTVLSEQSGVNESGVEGFPGADVQVGRTGQTGGGTNPQWLSEAEGGAPGTGEISSRFEGLGGPEDKKAATLAANPGGYDARPRGIDETPDRSKKETVPVTTGQELQPDQEATAQSHSVRS
ncbi:unnamed protein product [Parajaminaea phylloscopi]